MFWIIGADALVAALKPLNQASWFQRLTDQLEHVEWEGYRFYDLIFPLFVFLVGLSSVFSLGRIVETEGRTAAYGRLVRRAALLYVLGLFYYGGRPIDSPEAMFRYVGVLQRLAICYLGAGLIFLNFSWRPMVGITAGLLLGYWALLALVPVPGFGRGDFDPGHNLTNYLDQHYLPGFKWDGNWDPEGMLSNLPAVASAMLGIFAGLILQNTNASPAQRAKWLAGLGIACLAAGTVWGWQFPIIKKLWTSSYVLVAGGWSYLLLALFYTIIDIGNYRRWAQPFVWIGMNPIAIYLATNLADPIEIVRRVIHPSMVAAMHPYGEVVVALLGLSLAIWVCYWLYRRQIFIRV
jgi:predicted acyltransferase